MPPHALTARAPLYRRKVIGSAQTLELLAERLVRDEPLVRGGVPQIRIPLMRDRAALYDGRVGSAQGFLDDLEARERGRAWSRSGHEHIGGFPKPHQAPQRLDTGSLNRMDRQRPSRV
jgi:hypothetical protein